VAAFGGRSYDRTSRNRIPLNLPVGGPLRTAIDADWKAAGPARQTRELPATNDGVRQATRVVTESFSSPEWELVNPVGVDLVRGVEIRNRTQSIRVPGVDDLAAQSAPFADPLGVGSDVNGP